MVTINDRELINESKPIEVKQTRCSLCSHLLSWVAAVEHHTGIKLCGVHVLKGQLWLLSNHKRAVRNRRLKQPKAAVAVWRVT